MRYVKAVLLLRPAGYILKPINPYVLTDKIEKVLGKVV